MKIFKLAAISALSLSFNSFNAIADESAPFAEGDKVYSIANLHADYKRNRFYAMNYQLPKLVPICSEFVIEDIGSKDIELKFNGVDFDYVWDKHTKNAGQSLEENFKLFFAKSCDAVQKKIKSLSKIDQEGIASGHPKIGMSKEGVLLAMGRPPIHANPNLDALSWVYWTNKWAKDILEFDDKGNLKNIIK